MSYLSKCFRIYSWNILNWINRRVLKTYPLIEDCARCCDCGRNVHDYHVPDELWLEVIGKLGGVWCYDCFANRADERLGVKWRMDLVEKWQGGKMDELTPSQRERIWKQAWFQVESMGSSGWQGGWKGIEEEDE